MSKLNTGTLKDISYVAWIAAYGDTDTCVKSYSDGDHLVSLKEMLSENGLLTALVHYASHVSLRDVEDEGDIIQGDVLHIGGEFSGVSLIENPASLNGISLDDSIDCTDGVANKIHYLLESIYTLCPKDSNSLYPNVTNAFLYIDKIKEAIKNEKVLTPIFQPVDAPNLVHDHSSEQDMLTKGV